MARILATQGFRVCLVTNDFTYRLTTPITAEASLLKSNPAFVHEQNVLFSEYEQGGLKRKQKRSEEALKDHVKREGDIKL